MLYTTQFITTSQVVRSRLKSTCLCKVKSSRMW